MWLFLENALTCLLLYSLYLNMQVLNLYLLHINMLNGIMSEKNRVSSHFLTQECFLEIRIKILILSKSLSLPTTRFNHFPQWLQSKVITHDHF